MKFENFDIYCSAEEAYKLKCFSFIHILPMIRECYYNAVHNDLRKGKTDNYYTELSALSSIFVMGYVSGVRAEREKKRANSKR